MIAVEVYLLEHHDLTPTFMLHPKQHIGVSRTMKQGRVFKDFKELLVCIKKFGSGFWSARPNWSVPKIHMK